LRADPLRILVVDDDANLRAVLRASFESADLQVEDAENAMCAAQRIAVRRPDVIVLDVAMPEVDGLTFCRGLKSDPRTRDISVILLTGTEESEDSGRRAGADAFVRKPFSPLALLRLVERLGATANANRPAVVPVARDGGQLLLYAQDFRRLLEVERGQRRLIQNAYVETVVALTQALAYKDGGTSAHSERVRRYATELAAAVEPALLEEASVDYGFILHDVGKVAIPDAVLNKPGPLTASERRLIETHPILGEQMLENAPLIQGEGLQVVRSHHERWDGCGYPDGLVAHEIPLVARIFSLADSLDAMTSDRPYRKARTWPLAVDEIVAEAGTQFDPGVVDAFLRREHECHRIYGEVRAD
jgi:response regulator RpfG family c-di-GMP phosphodiesterase